jgi:Mrp family chromosome partitioning ATPase
MAMELDMRRPTMARTLGLKSGQQFSEVLAGRAAAADQLSRVGTNLALATNARPEPAAAELLAGRGAAHVIDRMEADFAPDVMLFDLPPLLMTDDAMAFMDQIDCVLLVAAAERNTMAQITRCAEDLAARCNFLGVILNKCRFLPTDERYGYGEGYGD